MGDALSTHAAVAGSWRYAQQWLLRQPHTEVVLSILAIQGFMCQPIGSAAWRRVSRLGQLLM